MILALSDLHGRLDELKILLKRVNEQHPLKNLKIVFLGDYIGYGKQNIEMVNFLMKFKENYPETVLLKGNWEETLWYSLRGKSIQQQDYYKRIFERRKQSHVLEAFQNTSQIKEYLTFIQKMPLFHIEKDIAFVHAGVNFERWKKEFTIWEFMKQQARDELLWDDHFYTDVLEAWTDGLNGDDNIMQTMPFSIVSGHAPIPFLYKKDGFKPIAPLQIGNVYGIDFGASRKSGYIGAVLFKENGMETFIEKVK